METLAGNGVMDLYLKATSNEAQYSIIPVKTYYSDIPTFIFFGGQRKRSKRKAALNLASGYPRATVACGGSANSSRQVGTQTVRTLFPHANAALGCVEWEKQYTTKTTVTIEADRSLIRLIMLILSNFFVCVGLWLIMLLLLSKVCLRK